MHTLAFHPYIKSFAICDFSSSLFLSTGKDKEAMEEDCQRDLEPSFTYGYECCVFKHNIRGDQLEVLNCTLDSPNFIFLECVVGLLCPLVWVFYGDATTGEHRREVAEESGRGAPLRDLNEHPLCGSTSSSFFFRSGLYTIALLLPLFL